MTGVSRRRRASVLAVAFTVSLLPAVAGRAGEPAAGWSTNCTEDSWVGGTTEWCSGALVYRDYVYDDTGADTAFSSPHGTSLNDAAGDVDHRQHGQALNSADLLTLRIEPDGDELVVTALLNTLFPGDATVLALAVDSDNDAATGGGPWGNGIAVASAGHDRVHVLGGRDAVANTIVGRIPAPATGSPWRLQAVTALGDGTVMNVAFRGTGETGNWWDEQQADALAAGDVSAFGVVVDPADLDGSTHRPATNEPGFYERIYRSDFSVPRTPEETSGEGVAYEGVPGRGASDQFGQSFWYLGHHQPYGVYIPPATGEPFGIQLALHGYSAAHASLVGAPGMQQRFGDDLHRIVVVPLGRGPEGYYSDYSERDVLDVLDDLVASYPVDEAQVFSGGYSMGGYGAYRFAALYPDRFAGMVNWVGFSGDCLQGTPAAQGRARQPLPAGLSDASAGTGGRFTNDPAERGGCPTGAVGNVFDYLDNLRYVPSALMYSAADELVWANHAVALRERFAALGYEHALWVHTAEHLSYAVLDDWGKEAAFTAGRVRPDTVSRVTYRTNPWMWSPALGIVQDGAWWVDGMVPRDRGPNTAAWAPGSLDVAVDLTSHACPADQYGLEVSNGAGADPVPWVSQIGTPVALAAAPAANAISGTLTNVAEVTVDVAGACLDPTQPVTLDVTSDGPAVIHLVFPDGVEDRPVGG